MIQEKDSPPHHTEKSLNRSASYNGGTLPNLEGSFESSGLKHAANDLLDPNSIELQLEDALMNEKLKQLDVVSTPENKSSAEKSRGIEDLRDPRFFMSKVDDESLGDTHGKNTPLNLAENREELSDG